MSYEYSILDIKKDQIFCEYDGYGSAFRYQAIENGHLEGDFHVIHAKMIDEGGCPHKFFVSKNYLHYGPELYIGDYSIPYSNVKYLN